ncbi:MAG: rhomboid family intramembrane serine protease [Deltaproteobacteria bacterium]|nr:rhomboid family intramembrane serine protease [Deltaproteobacteria bacterium]
MPNPETLLLAVVARLVDDEAIPARLLALGDAAAVLAMADESLTAVFTPAFGPAEAIGTKLRAIVEDNPGVHIKLAIIGGDPSLRTQMPSGGGGLVARRAVQLFHLSPAASGEPWSLWTAGGGRADSPLGSTLGAAAAGELPVVERAAVEARVDAPAPLSADDRARLEDRRAFIAQLGARPLATWGLLAVLVAIFGLEVWWGGGENIPTLVRMGANTPHSTASEPWRLLSSALLHAGVIHIGFNGYVLLVLGGFVEKILGAGRYGVLLGAAALGGGLASAVAAAAPVSVGASGAIFGALGAAAALAWKPGETIPEVLVTPLRRSAGINLALGVGMSFMPGVDMWAHFGGGAVGAGLVLSGVLVRNLPPIGRVASGKRTGSSPTHSEPASDEPAQAGGARSSRTWTIAAGLVAGVMGAALVTAWVEGQPWRLREQPRLVSHTLAPGLEVQAPQMVGAPIYERDAMEREMWMLGDPLRDPLTLAVVARPRTIGAEGRAEQAKYWAANGPQTPADAEVVEAWAQRNGVEPPTYAVVYRYPTGIMSGLWIQLRPDAEIHVESVYWPASDGRWKQAVQQILADLERSEP